MDTNDDDLEKQCEDAVFKICCTRESYSVRCANQLEKQLLLKRKIITAPVQKAPFPNFEVPVITAEQQELFQEFSSSKKSHQAKTSEEVRVKDVLSTLKEMESILQLIERSKSSEWQKLLED